MQIYHLTAAPDLTDTVPCGAVFLFGSFDGVHTGHRSLLHAAAQLADNGRDVVVWTVEDVPKSSAKTGFLTTADEKLALLGHNGAQYVMIENFSDVRSLSGESFFFDRIAAQFKPYAVVCGKNFRFGKHAQCTADDLARFAEQAGIRCTVLDLLEKDSVPVSSTLIRERILDGDVKSAASLLGYPYSVTSPILHGKALGRTIGCPTVNQRLPKEKIMPARGVYACTVSYEKNGTAVTRMGVCNIGSRPTVNMDESDITLETYILDFSDDLYGVTVTTRLYSRIRPEQSFSDIGALSEQIRKDAAAARQLLADVPLT